MPTKPAHGFEVNMEPAPGPTFNPLDSIDYFPSAVAQFFAARSVLAPTFDIHVGAAGLSSGSTISAPGALPEWRTEDQSPTPRVSRDAAIVRRRYRGRKVSGLICPNA